MSLKVAFVLAHPDDETFCSAILIHRLAQQGHRPILLLATKGEAAKTGPLGPLSKEELAAVRAREMEKAGALLGIQVVEQLGYPDGKLAEAEEQEAAGRIAEFLDRHQADVVVTFPASGNNGHPDHIAIHRLTKRAVEEGSCETLRSFYVYAPMGVNEQVPPGTFRIDSKPDWLLKAEALRAHASQMFAVERVFGKGLAEVPEAYRYESFTLAWTRGGEQDAGTEQGILEKVLIFGS